MGNRPLQGKVAVVAGATRGAGRAMAEMLGEAGALVYCTGRSSRAAGKGPGAPAQAEPAGGPGPSFILSRRPETIEDTAAKVEARGGKAVAVKADHTVEAQVAALFEKIKAEQGKLDILVNDVWGGDELTEFGKPFWELNMAQGFLLLQRAVHTHILTARYGVPLMLASGAGLVVEVTDGDTARYRGNLFYDLAKSSVIRLALAMGEELKPKGIAALALTPGFLRSEAMLEYFGVTEANWRDGTQKDPHFIASETPYFVGRAVAALAADPEIMDKTGKAFSSWGLAKEYGFTDMDGSRPDWGTYFDGLVASGAI